MRSKSNDLATLAFTISAIVVVTGCEGETRAQNCNGDIECPDAERCVDGLCVAVDVEPDVGPGVEPDPDPPIDGGIADGGITDGGFTGDGGITDGGFIRDGGITDGGQDAGPSQQWWDPAWPSRVSIDIPPSADGDVVDLVIPIARSLDPALSDSSLRLATAAGTLLSFETTPETLWVKIPRIDDTGAQVFAYFGRDDAPPAGHPADPWSDARGVWHFDEDLRDSSPNDVGGLDGAVPTPDGKIGGARALGAAVPAGSEAPLSNRGVRLPPTRRYTGGVTQITMAMWVKAVATPVNPQRNLFSVLPEAGGAISRAALVANPGVGYRIRVGALGSEPTFTTAFEPDFLEWTFVVAIADFEAQLMQVYENGALVEEGEMDAFVTAPEQLRGIAGVEERSGLAAIGSEDNAVEDVFDGTIDEFRIFTRALSAAAIATSFAHEQAAGTLVTIGTTESQFAGAVTGQPPTLAADTTVVPSGQVAVADLRANDTGAGLTLVSVTELSSPSGIETRILADGRVEVRAPAGVGDLIAVFEAIVSDGKHPPQVSPWTIEIVGDNDVPQCRAFQLNIAEGETERLDVRELASDPEGAPLLIQSATSLRGDVEILADAVAYAAPLNDLPLFDYLTVVVSDGTFSCTSVVTLSFDAFGLDAPALPVAVDSGHSRIIELTLVEGATEYVLDLVTRGNQADLTPVFGNVFSYTPPVGTANATELVRYHVLGDAGRAGPSGLIEFTTRPWASGEFLARVKVDLDATDVTTIVRNLSVLLDFSAVPDDPVLGGFRFFAPGSVERLPLQFEGPATTAGSKRFRVRVPAVYPDPFPSYIWAYYAENPGDVAPVDVWDDDVLGAWGFSEGYDDQTGNGHHAVGESLLTNNGFDASLAAPGQGVEVPGLAPLGPQIPLTVEVVFQATEPWAAATLTQSLVTKYFGANTGNYHLCWAGLDYSNPNAGKFTLPGFMGKLDSETVNEATYAWGLFPTVAPDTTMHLAHVIDGDGIGTIYLNGEVVGDERLEFGDHTLGADFDAPWVFGAGKLDPGNFATVEPPPPFTATPSMTLIRSARIRNAAMTPDRILLQARSELFEIAVVSDPDFAD